MKPFVSDRVDAVNWKSGGPSPRLEPSSGGRFHRLPDLWDLVLPIVGAVFFAELLGLIQMERVVQFLLAGLAFGAVAGRSVVVWREERGGELPPELVRKTERSWVLAGAAVSLLLCLLS